MNNISKLKDGKFYFVEKLDKVDEMFIDAIGGLFSVVAQNVKIEVWINKENKNFSDANISKTFGDIWKKENEKNLIYSINIL